MLNILPECYTLSYTAAVRCAWNCGSFRQRTVIRSYFIMTRTLMVRSQAAFATRSNRAAINRTQPRLFMTRTSQSPNIYTRSVFKPPWGRGWPSEFGARFSSQ